jgi:hypothetical protein
VEDVETSCLPGLVDLPRSAIWYETTLCMPPNI